MTFTYTGNLSDSLDYLRFRLNDKEEEYAEYSDEELQYFIDKLSGAPAETDLNKIALRLLKQQLQEIMRGPSRERAGQYECYSASAQSLQLAIKELEEDIKNSRGVATPSFGGVYKSDYCKTRKNNSLVQSAFSKGNIYGDGPCGDGC